MGRSEAKGDIRYSVVIPVYNEGRAVAPCCARVREAMADVEGGFEIICVDDGSTDDGIASTPEGVDLVLRHRRNRGYGAALKTGFARARGDIVIFLDADGTYDPAYLPSMIEALTDDVVMVVGARTGAEVHIPLARRPAKWLLRTLSNYLSGRRIPDLNSGFRVVRRSALEDYVHLFPEGFSLTTTLTLACLCDGREIAYLPIHYPPRKEGRSKIRPFQDTRDILFTILRTVMCFDPMKVFVPVGGALGLAAVAVLALSWALMDTVMDGTVAVLALASFQSIAIGLLADTIIRTGRAKHTHKSD